MRKKYAGIREARIKQNMTQEQLAMEVKVDVFTIKEWEQGMGVLSLHNLIVMTEILDTSANFLVFNEQRKPLLLNNLNSTQQKEITNLYKNMISLNR